MSRPITISLENRKTNILVGERKSSISTEARKTNIIVSRVTEVGNNGFTYTFPFNLS